MTPESARYLVEGMDRPWLAADDVTEPAREIEPELRFLPPADAFYVFAGWLGERRLLPGRDGPPGADYNTLPAFKSKAVQLALFYWAEGAVGLSRHARRAVRGRPPERARAGALRRPPRPRSAAVADLRQPRRRRRALEPHATLAGAAHRL